MRIIPESERRLMTRKELDKLYSGCGVLYDDRSHIFRELGIVLAVCDNTDDEWDELLRYAQGEYSGECSIIYAKDGRYCNVLQIRVHPFSYCDLNGDGEYVTAKFCEEARNENHT